MPKIIYGTAWKQERTAGLVEQAIGLGFKGIDTACQPKHYHEAGVGDGIVACINRGLITRRDLYLQTKFTPVNGQDPERIPYDPNASLAEQVAQSARVSCLNLQTDYLDCLVLHSPMPTMAQTQTVWRAMELLIDGGYARQLGISNCYDVKLLASLVEFANVKPAVIQNRFYANTEYDKAIRAFCQHQNIVYQSFWTLTANPHILQDDQIKQVADTYQRSTVQVFFRYLSQIGIVPLTGTTSEQHMKDDLAIFEFELNREEIALIGELFR